MMYIRYCILKKAQTLDTHLNGNYQFLERFNHILTYWSPLLTNESVSYCPFINRRDLDLDVNKKLLFKQ